MTRLLSYLNRGSMRGWVRKIGAFFLGQGAIQLLSLATGFLLLRWLSVESYAQYSVAFGFQSSVGVLVDLGFSGAIIAMVGPRIADPAVTGRYIRSVLHYRTLLFLIIALPAAGAFIWMTGRQHWSWAARTALFGSVLFSLYFQGWTSCYSAPIVMHHRYGPFYRAQFMSGVFRLVACSLAHFLSVLTAPVTAWISSVSLAFMGFLYRQRSLDIVSEPPRADPEANREILRYVMPIVPTTIFNALESQITIFLITFFGKSHNIAEVAALGRLTQALVILLAFNGIVITPYIARLPYSRLASQYWLILMGAMVVGATLWGISIFVPGPLLWVVGSKYAHLGPQLPWCIAGWGFYYLSSVMWAMHSARKWVFWWHSTLHCTSLILAQIVGVWLLDLSTTLGIFEFSLMAACTNCGVQMVGGLYGYWAEGRGKLPAAHAGSAVEPEAEPAAVAP